MKKNKKKKFKKIYWLLIDLAIAAVILVLLLHKPGRYMPPKPPADKQISRYLTNELLPQLYNGVQRGEPFDLTVSQDGINDAIASSKWPKESEGAKILTPQVFFVPDGAIVMGPVVMKGVEFVVTVELKSAFDAKGLLTLNVEQVKIGAMNITPIARIVARKMYTQQLAKTDVDTENTLAKIAASLLNSEPFEPVFKVEKKKVR
ncbi:MAG: hypothetical protein NTW55_04525, partial [Planctomycetota bacterium]|nr:hypothetical protein [Planctomycetota bacterium]